MPSVNSKKKNKFHSTPWSYFFFFSSQSTIFIECFVGRTDKILYETNIPHLRGINCCIISARSNIHFLYDYIAFHNSFLGSRPFQFILYINQIHLQSFYCGWSKFPYIQINRLNWHKIAFKNASAIQKSLRLLCRFSSHNFSMKWKSLTKKICVECVRRKPSD